MIENEIVVPVVKKGSNGFWTQISIYKFLRRHSLLSATLGGNQSCNNSAAAARFGLTSAQMRFSGQESSPLLA